MGFRINYEIIDMSCRKPEHPELNRILHLMISDGWEIGSTEEENEIKIIAAREDKIDKYH
jgi:hypothetical protein